MCVIVVKPKGVKVSLEVLKACQKSNPNYCGYAYPVDGAVRIRKGFRTAEDMYLTLPKDWQDKPMLFHFRIATSGDVTPENAHPFPVTASFERMQMLNVRTSMAVAHNGVINMTGMSREEADKYSDTELYVRYVLSLLNRNGIEQELEDTVNPKYGHNKFATLTGDGTLTRYGMFDLYAGCYFSNLYWQMQLPKEKKEPAKVAAHASTGPKVLGQATLADLDRYMSARGGNTRHGHTKTGVPCPTCGVDLLAHEVKAGICDDCQAAIWS